MLRWKDSSKFLPTVDQLWGIFQWLYQNPSLSRLHTYVSEIARGLSLAVQWLWFHVFNVGAWVPFLVWKLRPHMPCGTTKKKSIGTEASKDNYLAELPKGRIVPTQKVSISTQMIRRKAYWIGSHYGKRKKVMHLASGLTCTEGNSEHTSNTSGGWKAQDQVIRIFSFWWDSTFWFIDSHLFLLHPYSKEINFFKR